MSRSRGRPARGDGVSRDDILEVALSLLDQGELTMRAVASHLGITPMSLYHHVDSRIGLLRAISDRVYRGVLVEEGLTSPRDELQSIMRRYFDAVGRHPQLTLAIFAEPEAFAGVTREITNRLTVLLKEMTATPVLWRDILVDHAHGSGLSVCAGQNDKKYFQEKQKEFEQALNRLLDCLLCH